MLSSKHSMVRCVRIKMRSDQYAASRQDADTGEGYQELRSPIYDGRYGLPGMDVCRSRFEGLYRPLALWVVQELFIGNNDV
jgi:hypothetical protein